MDEHNKKTGLDFPSKISNTEESQQRERTPMKTQAQIITDTITKIRSTRGGKTVYTITAQVWNGKITNEVGWDKDMNIATFKGLGLGRSVELGGTSSAKEATQWIKEAKKKGKVLEMDVFDPMAKF